MKMKITPNTVEIETKLKQLGDLDTTPLMAEISGYLLESADNAFIDQADPETGEAWQPLTEAYAKWKQKHGYSNDLLFRTGELSLSLINEHEAKKARAGSNMIYAGTMNFGFDENGLHARRFLGIDAIAKENILEAIKKAYSEPLKS